MEKTYTIRDLVEIVSILRSENGCPWDRKQTHGSLKPCMIEEAYEAVDGIRILEESGSWENLCEELGDVLLQVLMHSQIAQEEGLFTLDDVIQGISEKMIRRHPHVFGGGEKPGESQVPVNWEEIKRREKKDSGVSELGAVPHNLPALIRTSKVLKKLEAGKQMYADEKASFAHARRMLDQLENSEGSEAEEGLIGELLLDVCNISRKRKVNGEQALTDCLEELIRQNE